jgi:hypothetical protein
MEALLVFGLIITVVAYPLLVLHALIKGRLLWFAVMIIAAPAAILYLFADDKPKEIEQ